jgi:hypothetical protein
MSNMKMWSVDYFLTPSQVEHLHGISVFPPSSITSWDDFERVFIRKFGERKTTTSLYKELGAIKMDKREKVKYFNQIFLNVLTKFTNDTTPAQSLAIEYYTTTLIPSIGMFVKQANKNTLALNFDEAETVERELSSYDHHSHPEEIKSAWKETFVANKTTRKGAKRY